MTPLRSDLGEGAAQTQNDKAGILGKIHPKLASSAGIGVPGERASHKRRLSAMRRKGGSAKTGLKGQESAKRPIKENGVVQLLN